MKLIWLWCIGIGMLWAISEHPLARATSVYIAPEQCRNLLNNERIECIKKSQDDVELKRRENEQKAHEKKIELDKQLDDLTCHTDDDCVAIKNGCGVRKIFQNSKNLHTHFTCTCIRDSHGSECVPSSNVHGIPTTN